MAFSVNTNRGAMVALQSLNTTNKGLDTVQKRVSTGLAVASTKDDSATFVTAQNLRGKTSDLKAVTSSLTNAKSVVDVAVSGVEQVSDLANQMRTLAKQAADTTISNDQRVAYNSDFGGLMKQITTIVNASEFNGTNLLKSTGGAVTALQSLAPAPSPAPSPSPSPSPTPTPAATYSPDTLSVLNQGMTLVAATGGNLGYDTTIDTATNAATAVTALDKYITDSSTGLNKKLSDLGSASRNIDASLSFASKLGDTLESGIGNLVDADMAKESARMQALQTKQQLGIQALSMANQGPSSIGQLFR